MSVSEVPTYYLGKAVAGRMEVLLCGEGADELFGGYKRFAPISVAPFLPRPVLQWDYIRGITGLAAGDRLRLYSPRQAAHLGGNGNPWLEEALARPGNDMLNRFLRYELTQHLRSQVKRLDKLTRAHGVEARCPFLNPLLVQYVANLPPGQKLRGLNEKALLKGAMAVRLPAAIIERRKFGMSNSAPTLFRGDFRDLCREALLDGRDVLEPFFSMTAIDRRFGQLGRHPVWWRIPE